MLPCFTLKTIITYVREKYKGGIHMQTPQNSNFYPIMSAFFDHNAEIFAPYPAFLHKNFLLEMHIVTSFTLCYTVIN